MKFMKLGSKPDAFQAEGDGIRYVATDLATDIVISIGDVKFFLHKFPLLSKSARLQKLVAISNDENSDEIHIEDLPGGPAAFEICAKFCYGMTVTLNAYNVVAARCAAEYLEMHELIEKGNLIYKVDVFLSSSIFRSWKDSIIVLQTTKSLLPMSEELKIVGHCLDSIASKASMDPAKVEWSYTYNRKKLPSENGDSPQWNGVRKMHSVPKDWWVEDLCDLHIDLYKRIVATIRTKGRVSDDIIGEALNAYALRRLPGFSKGMVQGSDLPKYRSLVEAILWLLPLEKGSVSCSFLFRLLKAATILGCGDKERNELMKRTGQHFEEAAVSDLLIRAPEGERTIYDVDIVHSLVEEFVKNEQNSQADPLEDEFPEIRSPKHTSGAAKAKVAKIVDGYLAEVARDPNLPVSKFVNLAEMVTNFSRTSHDGLYRAIDMFLKEHPGINKSEKKRICKLMDCRKLSAEACTHAVQNERLPLRVVVQVLFFEQVKASANAGSTTPDLPGSMRALLPGGSHGSSRSTTTNTEEDWDSAPTAEDIKALKGDLPSLRLGGNVVKNGNSNARDSTGTDSEKMAAGKTKGMVMTKLFSKLWSGKEKNGESSSSDTSESPGSGYAEERKSTPCRSRRQSVS